PDPERSLGPREPRVTAAARRRNRREHTPGLRIDPFDATLDDLEQVPAVEGRTGIRADLDRAQQLPARRIEGPQPVSRSDPHLPAVVRDAVYVVDTRKGPVLADDLGAGSAHDPSLVGRERGREQQRRRGSRHGWGDPTARSAAPER